MVQQGQIDHLLQESGEIQPPASLVQQVYLKNPEAEYQRSVDDPDTFWAEVAGELDWFKPWNKVFEWQYPDFQWFSGATCNITYNCLDRHVGGGRKNKAAFIWLGEDGSERIFTYGMVAQTVNRFANGLKSGRRQGGPGGDLHAPDPRRGHCHARLRPHRRNPQRGIRGV